MVKTRSGSTGLGPTGPYPGGGMRPTTAVLRFGPRMNGGLVTLSCHPKAVGLVSTRNRPFATLLHLLNERPVMWIAAR